MFGREIKMYHSAGSRKWVWEGGQHKTYKITFLLPVLGDRVWWYGHMTHLDPLLIFVVVRFRFSKVC